MRESRAVIRTTRRPPHDDRHAQLAPVSSTTGTHGIDVTLSWSPAGDQLYVTVLDDAGGGFELTVEAHEAVEVFDHPYAYAAHRESLLLDVAA